MHLGLAIARDRIVAVELRATVRGVRPGRVHERALGAAPKVGAWPELAEALRELQDVLGARRVTVDVALLPPLSCAKVLALPSLGRRDLRTLVERNARRFFLSAAEEARADAAPTAWRWGRGPRPTLGICADRNLIETIEDVLTDAGFACATISPAAPALARAVSVIAPATQRRRVVVAVDIDGWKEGIAVDRGRARLFESWNWVPPDELSAAAARLGERAFGESATPSVVPLSAPESAQRWAEVGETESVDREVLGTLEPGALAAFGATQVSEDQPVLASPARRRLRERTLRRRAVALWSMALLLVGMAAHLHLTGLRRELAAVVAQRDAHATEVSTAFEQQWLAGALRERLEALQRQQVTLPQWTPVLAALARALPDSAYLLSVTVDSSGLRVEGVAPGAAEAVRALQASPELSGVELLAAFRQDGVDAMERFDLLVAHHPAPGYGPGRSVAAPGGGP